MTPEEQRSIERDIKKLEKKETEYYNWMVKNTDSGSFEEVRKEWNIVRFKIQNLNDRLIKPTTRNSFGVTQGSLPVNIR